MDEKEEQLVALTGEIVHLTYYDMINVEIIGVLRAGKSDTGKYRVVTGDGHQSFGYVAFDIRDVYCIGTYYMEYTNENCVILERRDKKQ